MGNRSGDSQPAVKMLEERIDDDVLIRLIRKWLKAGVLEESVAEESPEPTAP